MKRLLHMRSQEDGLSAEEWWNAKQEKQLGNLFIRSGKPSKIQGPGLLRCAECGGEVKVLVSPRRNPHSSKLGRAVSMKDHDLCRRCWRRAVQQSPQGVVIPFPKGSAMVLRRQSEQRMVRHHLPKTGS